MSKKKELFQKFWLWTYTKLPSFEQYVLMFFYLTNLQYLWKFQLDSMLSAETSEGGGTVKNRGQHSFTWHLHVLKDKIASFLIGFFLVFLWVIHYLIWDTTDIWYYRYLPYEGSLSLRKYCKTIEWTCPKLNYNKCIGNVIRNAKIGNVGNADQ